MLRPWLRLALLGLVLPAWFASAEEPPLVVGRESGVEDQFYAVRGQTADEVFRSIEARKLGDVPGRGASGLTESRLEYTMETATQAGSPCRVTALDLRLTIDVTLPRHEAIGSLDDDTRRNWEIYATAVELHEYRHVEIELRGLDEVAARLERVLGGDRIRGSEMRACRARVDEILRSQRATTRRRHDDFHREDARSVRGLQREGQKKLHAVEDKMETLRATARELEALIEALQEERRLGLEERNVLVEEWGGRLPEPHYARAQALGETANLLGSRIRETRDERNTLVTEFEILREEHARRAEDLSWIR